MIGVTSHRRRRQGWRRFLRPATLVLAAVAAWLVVAGLMLFWARNDATEGLRLVQEAQARSSPGELAEGRPIEPLRRAQASFDSAGRLLGSPALAPLRVLPIVGRQVRSGHKLTTAAADVAGVGVDTVGEASSALSRPHRSGAERIALLQELSRITGQAEARLARIDPGPGRALVGPIASKRRELVDRLEEARRGLREGHGALQGLASMLSGSRYLVLAANNSEMRAGSGMFLSAGELRTSGGDLSLGEFRTLTDLVVPASAAPPIQDADLAARWGWLAPNREWRNLALTPRFPASAALASRMWTALGNPAVDGVLALDPIFLQAVIRATGPVSAGGRTLTADEVDDFLLHDQYAGITSFAANQVRREQLGAIAKATFDALQQRDWDVGVLASGLADAAQRRHILAWSARPAEQEGWAAAKVDGSLDPSSLVVSVLNSAGNKLDRFLNVEARLGFEPQGGSAAATLEVSLRNVTPDGEPTYVAGPYPASDLAPGDYSGLLAVNLPAQAGDVTVEGQERFSAAGRDGPTNVVAFPVMVKKGGAQTFTMRFRLPEGHGPVRVEPSARVPAERWTGPGGRWESGEARLVTW